MKLASYITADGRPAYGTLDASSSSLTNLVAPEAPDLQHALSVWGVDGIAQRAASAAERVPVDSVRWQPPIPQPGKILCVGINYASHGAETDRAAVPHPSLFIRFADSLVGHDNAVLAPRNSTQFDYEAELAVVIGRHARHLRPEEARSVVLGYACFAENSVRDYQKHAAQVTAGKNFHASGGWGPWIVTADEIDDVQALEVVGRLNGREMQRDSIAHLIHSIDKLVAYVSEFTPLAPGDVIATGTPAGVGAARKPPVFMSPGDVLEVEITSLGVLRLPVAAEPTPHSIAGVHP